MKFISTLLVLASFNLFAAETFYGYVKGLQGPKKVHYERTDDGNFITQGDILVRPVLLNSNSNSSSGAKGVVFDPLKYSNRLWTNNTIVYDFDENMPEKATREVYNAMKYLQTYSDIQFKERTTESNYVHMKFSCDDPKDGNCGCSSYIGMIGGEQQLTVAGWCSSDKVVHEFLHALGFYHEQSRADRDMYVDVIQDNILPDSLHNFDHVSDSMSVGTFDFDSIMLYHSWAFSKDNSPTLLRKNKSTFSGGKWMSNGDFITLAKLYNTIKLNISSVKVNTIFSGEKFKIVIANAMKSNLSNLTVDVLSEGRITDQRVVSILAKDSILFKVKAVPNAVVQIRFGGTLLAEKKL